MIEFLSQEIIEEFVNSFSCSRDLDIEFFLKNKALLFQKKNKVRNYFILDEEKFIDGELDILAYFALSTKVLYLPEELSKSQRKKIDGLYNSVSEVSTFLIGQIGKNDKNKEKISGREILQYACDYLEEASEIIAGRVILVELKDNPKLISFYEKNDFHLLKNNTKNEENLLQMIKII